MLGAGQNFAGCGADVVADLKENLQGPHLATHDIGGRVGGSGIAHRNLQLRTNEVRNQKREVVIGQGIEALGQRPHGRRPGLDRRLAGCLQLLLQFVDDPAGVLGGLRSIF